MPCLVSPDSQRVLLICGGMSGRLILLLITDKLQNQVLSQPLDQRQLKCLVKLRRRRISLIVVCIMDGSKQNTCSYNNNVGGLYLNFCRFKEILLLKVTEFTLFYF